MEGHLHQQTVKDNQPQNSIPGIFSQLNYMSGGMYASVAQPCEGGGEKLFAQWTVVKPSDLLMNHNQHQIMNNQGFNIDTGGGDRLFAQQNVGDPCDFSMAQYWKHQILSHQDVNINSSSAQELFPQ
ncbi:hypothetical protein EJD97_013433 [Solanum chilense]|uniref:Uncharacterized protein n=1 Tax=Solanum chilense TaxID=4083 RepID=A0A6N2AFC9_SOLCI|nr:hypothetical protein EJD97_013433 [Solanum chilense]